MLDLRTLGALDLQGPDGVTLQSVLLQPKRAAILVYLAAARPQGMRQRDELLPLFWPESDESSARHSLSQALYALRGSLGADAFETTGRDGIAVNPEAVRCDVVGFQEAVDGGRWEEALQLYAGPFLRGFHLPDADGFDRWADAERERLRTRAAAAAWALARGELERGDPVEAERRALEAIRLLPTNEAAVKAFLGSLCDAGDRAGADRFYRGWVALLADELELEPSPEIAALAQELTRGDHAPPEPAGPPDVAEVQTAPPAPIRTGTDGESQRYRTRWAAVGVALAAVVIGVFWYLSAAENPGSEEVMETRVAVLPFTVQGNDDLAYLEDGMADLLAMALDGAGELATVDSRAVISLVEREAPDPLDPESGGAIAEQLGAGRYILGDILSVGGQIRASASLYRGRGEPEATADATVADETAIFDLVDEIARQLVVEASETTGDQLTSIGAATTRSLPAMKAYLRGEALLRSSMGDPARARSAVAEYRKAVEADTAFSLAYFRMGYVESTAGGDGRPAAEQAHRFSYRLPRQERGLVECFAALMRSDGGQAEHWCHEVLRRDPSNADAWFLLGEAIHHFGLRRGRATAEVRAMYERALALEPTHLQHALLGHIAWVAVVEENFADWAHYMNRRVAIQPDHPRASVYGSLIAAWEGDREALEETVESIYTEPIAFMCYVWVSGGSMWVLDDRTATVRALRGTTTLDRSSTERALGHVVIAHEELAAGRLEAAREELATAQSLDPRWSLISKVYLQLGPYLPIKAEELTGLRDELLGWNPVAPNPRVWRFYLLGLLHDRLDDPSGAESFALELEALAVALAAEDPPDVSALAEDLALYLRARIAAGEGRYQDALSFLDETESERWWGVFERRAVWKQLYERWLTAEVLVALGRHQEALLWLAGMGMDGERSYMGVRHFRMAEIYEELGDWEKARYHYGRFITYWRDADPELQPQVEAARRAIEDLSTNR